MLLLCQLRVIFSSLSMSHTHTHTHTHLCFQHSPSLHHRFLGIRRRCAFKEVPSTPTLRHLCSSFLWIVVRSLLNSSLHRRSGLFKYITTKKVLAKEKVSVVRSKSHRPQPVLTPEHLRYRGFRDSQRFSGDLRCSGICCRVAEWLVPEVSGPPGCLGTLRTSHPDLRRHMPEERRPWQSLFLKC